MQDKALQSEKMQDNPAKSRTVGNSAFHLLCAHCTLWDCTYTIFKMFHNFTVNQTVFSASTADNQVYYRSQVGGIQETVWCSHY